MSRHQETNPHFTPKPQRQPEFRRSVTPPPRQGGSRPRRDDQKKQSSRPRETELQSRGKGPLAVQPRGGSYYTPWVPPAPRQNYPESHFPLHGGFHSPWQQIPAQQDAQHPESHDGQHRPMVQPTQPQDQAQGASNAQHGSPLVQSPHPEDQGQGARVAQTRHPQQGVGPAGRPRHGLMPKIGRTKPIIWIAASICAIFWIVIFLGGLIVLIVYLAYRPRSPRFDVSSATLNAAYIDSGSLLNADVSVLANFTNPNKKVSVDFSYMIIDLYYGSTLIATQFIEPFSTSRAESRFANVHMVTSQVWLPLMEGQRLQEQMNRNAVIFEVKGVFRVRSNLGGFLRYSYRLYGHCTILLTSPPSGVLRATKCRTKR